MSAEIYLVADELPGALFIMPRPRAPLDDSLGHIRSLGVDRVISMLPPEEAEALGLASAAVHCAALGMTFGTHPIEDFGLPDGDTFDPFIHKIAEDLREGAAMAIHCRAGIGRSGMAVAATLIAMGWSAVAAVERISERRGVSIPDTEDQRRFLAEFELRQGER